MGDPLVERARSLLREQLRKHPDEGVRLLAEIAEVPADHPSVVAIVAMLRGTPRMTCPSDVERIVVVGALKPVRVQLRRTKGWRMPPNTVNVARPNRYGNPFPIGQEGPLGRTAPDAQGAVGFFRAMLRDAELLAEAGYPTDFAPLRGKNLACWCALGTPCHADALLELANGDGL